MGGGGEEGLCLCHMVLKNVNIKRLCLRPPPPPQLSVRIGQDSGGIVLVSPRWPSPKGVCYILPPHRASPTIEGETPVLFSFFFFSPMPLQTDT